MTNNASNIASVFFLNR